MEDKYQGWWARWKTQTSEGALMEADRNNHSDTKHGGLRKSPSRWHLSQISKDESDFDMEEAEMAIAGG